MLPQIGAVATANFNDDHTDMTPDRTYTAGGMLSWNFLGMGADVLKARAADAGRAKAAAEAAALRDEADNAVEKAWRDAVVAREMASAAKATIEQAAESFRAESERYKVGKSTTVELLGAQTQLTAAETGYQAALHGVAMADAALNVAVGRVPFPALMEGSR
jgi:outer membrane protein TolC